MIPLHEIKWLPTLVNSLKDHNIHPGIDNYQIIIEKSKDSSFCLVFYRENMLHKIVLKQLRPFPKDLLTINDLDENKKTELISKIQNLSKHIDNL